MELEKPPDGDVCETTIGSTGAGEVKCCDPNLEPGQNGNPFCFEGHQCCPDGEWSCSIGDGKTFPCGGDLITEGFGKACPCCDRVEEPKCETGPAACCDDGGWTCPIDKEGTTYDCGGGKESNPSGIICETEVDVEKPCCDMNDFLYCFIGTAGCCEDGSWSCPSNGIYVCGEDETKEPAGTICEEPGVVVPQGCTKDAYICPDGSTVGRDPNNNCEFRPCPVIKTTDTSPTGQVNEIIKTEEEEKAEREAERMKNQEEREEAKRQKEEERKKRQEEAARQKAERDAARDKKEAERLKRQEEKAAQTKGKRRGKGSKRERACRAPRGRSKEKGR